MTVLARITTWGWCGDPESLPQSRASFWRSLSRGARFVCPTCRIDTPSPSLGSGLQRSPGTENTKNTKNTENEIAEGAESAQRLTAVGAEDAEDTESTEDWESWERAGEKSAASAVGRSVGGVGSGGNAEWTKRVCAEWAKSAQGLTAVGAADSEGVEGLSAESARELKAQELTAVSEGELSIECAEEKSAASAVGWSFGRVTDRLRVTSELRVALGLLVTFGLRWLVLVLCLGLGLGLVGAAEENAGVEKSFDKPVVLPMRGDTVLRVVVPLPKVWSQKRAGVTLELLPLAVLGKRVDSQEREMVEAAIRLGAGEDSMYWVWTAEETDRNSAYSVKAMENCFTEQCLQGALRRLGHQSGLVLAGQFVREDSSVILKLVLLEADGRLHSALEASRSGLKESSDSLLAFVREAAARLVTEKSAPGFVLSFSAWSQIAWLNLRDTVDTRERTKWVGSGMFLGGLALALAEGQFLQRDHRIQYPTSVILDQSGESSMLRGFFSAPQLGPRYASMGGAGIAQVSNGLSVLMNPAGVADAIQENVVVAKGALPGGAPTLFIGYAGPLYHAWSKGFGVHYQGDGLASETIFNGALAFDLESLNPALAGIKIGAGLKLYLAEVGRDGNGMDHVTGYSVGTGLDLGLRARLNEKITAALTLRDIASILKHTNTFTDQSYQEVLPPEYNVGASYRVSPSLLLLLDGQKALLLDQDDHVRMGLEKIIFQFFSLRCGLHQIFGGTAVRKFTVGFGLNTESMLAGGNQTPLALNYGYEFGLNDDEPLGGGQQFSLELSF